MSFEFKGAIIARDLIITKGGHGDQADSVCEAIVRHQDIFVKGSVICSITERCGDTNLYLYRGNITMIGQILQLATILGEIGYNAMSIIIVTNILACRQCRDVSEVTVLLRLVSHAFLDEPTCCQSGS